MPPIGFSTGALARGNLASGVATARHCGTEALELSALRVNELGDLVAFVEHHDLSSFRYVSVHAPTDFTGEQEADVAGRLRILAERHHWFVVVHPDCICDPRHWQPLGRWLCVENMDKRKSTGRTADELAKAFERFPDAKLCFDIAHAHQVDTTMTEAYRILRSFGDRICQFHVSEVTSSSKHARISEMALRAYRRVADLLPRDVPVILESPVTAEQAPAEIAQAARIFEPTSGANLIRERGFHVAAARSS